jgi:hypothetical protein
MKKVKKENWDKNINLTEMMFGEELRQSPCKYGFELDGHACYCHHKDGYRKCPQWRNGEPYKECELYEKFLKF